MQLRVYYTADPGAPLTLYDEAPEAAAVAFLAEQPPQDTSRDTSQITVEVLHGSKSRGRLFHYRACDLMESDAYKAQLAAIARKEQAERQRKVAERRFAFRTKWLAAIIPAFGFVYALVTGHWMHGFALMWYMLVTTALLLGVTETFEVVRKRWFPIALLAVVGVAVTLYYQSTYFETTKHRVGAVAADGWLSSSTGRGTASHHGGVDHWIFASDTHLLSFEERLGRVLLFWIYLSPATIASVIWLLERMLLEKHLARDRPP